MLEHLFGKPRLVIKEQEIEFAHDTRYKFLTYLAAKADWASRDELATLLLARQGHQKRSTRAEANV